MKFTIVLEIIIQILEITTIYSLYNIKLFNINQTMELIMLSSQSEQTIFSKSLVTGRNIFTQKSIQTSRKCQQSSGKISESGISLLNVHKMQVIHKMRVDVNHKIFQYSLSLWKNQIQYIRNKINRISLIRKRLKANYQSDCVIYKIHPSTGEFCVEFQIYCYFNNIINSEVLLDLQKQHICYISQRLCWALFQTFTNISQLKPRIQPTDSLGNRFNAEELRRYIVHSSHYAWEALKNHTSSETRNIDNTYTEDKTSFINNIKQPKNSLTSISIQAINNKSVFNAKNQQVFTAQEDQKIKLRYLSKSFSIKQQSSLITKITLREDLFQQCKNKRQFRSSNPQGESVIIRVKKNNEQEKQNYMYELKILEQLPKHQVSGLPKYFLINSDKGYADYKFTNLWQSISYRDYLQRNSKVISLNTKLHILYQIIVTLQYLKQRKVVFHNLHPDKISIQRNLLTKLSDLSNSFHHRVRIRKIEMVFPYFVCSMSDLQYVCDERSTMHSFGYLVYYSLYMKCPVNLSESKIKLVKQKPICEVINIYNNSSIVALEKFVNQEPPMVQLLMNFVMKACQHRIEEKQTQTGSRPYMNWAVIVIRTLQEYYSK